MHIQERSIVGNPWVVQITLKDTAVAVLSGEKFEALAFIGDECDSQTMDVWNSCLLLRGVMMLLRVNVGTIPYMDCGGLFHFTCGPKGDD